MILDTSFIIDLMRKDSDAIAKLEELEKKLIPRIVTTPTLFELWSGIIQSNKSEEEKKKVIDVLIDQTILSLGQLPLPKGSGL